MNSLRREFCTSVHSFVKVEAGYWSLNGLEIVKTDIYNRPHVCYNWCSAYGSFWKFTGEGWEKRVLGFW